ncbi:OsmC family peroxiredoxin [Paraburkholderia dipogonis]|uniref:OsmC family peroxiredoxin n=1 Tax=Paraburkholderia dipogonis TaxID=1211383 RepID=A0A4Y8MIT8_9BURK|nr:OsmC family protein [Paraburkholderia dipogonis]TFE37386.1 OsmC family peroxiredoxin [Paraburkholderia dipogonis]
MSEHKIRVEWRASPHARKRETYSRDHHAIISEQVSIPVSAAPEFLGNSEFADPEQLLVNALASCHMLYFLAIAEGSGYVVQSYEDEAVGVVAKSLEGFQWVSKITLRPRVTFSSEEKPDHAQLARLHDRAHRGCFIANSIKSEFAIDLD